MRWCAEFERADHPGKILVDLRLRIAGNLERLVHNLGPVVADRARRQLDAVANDVILISENIERVHGFERAHLALRHREGIVTEIDFLCVLVIFIHRKIDDPAEFEAVLVDQIEFGADACPGGSRKFGSGGFGTGGEENAVIRTEAKRGNQFARCVFTVVFGNRTAQFTALLGDVPKTSIAFALSPSIHVIKEFAALFRGARCRNRAHDITRLNH